MNEQIFTIAEAAEWAKVSEAQIREWIAAGMKATPAGSIGRRGPRNYRIFREWVAEWMGQLAEKERRRLAEQRKPAAERPKAVKPVAVVSEDDPLGPCPAVRGRGH